MKAEELDKKFDDGEEVLQYFDLTSVRRPGLEIKRINIKRVSVFSYHGKNIRVISVRPFRSREVRLDENLKNKHTKKL